jgi:tetratricopeptide (TPR) repeat protein
MDGNSINSSESQSQGLGHDDLARQAANTLLQAEDSIIYALPIPNRRDISENDFGDADSVAVNLSSFNYSIINSVRFRNCRLLLSAGLPLVALEEFELLSALTFKELDTFYRALSVSIGARSCHDWYVKNSELISVFFLDFTEEQLAKNHKLFAATCIECAIVDKQYELAETIADSCDTGAPFEVRLLESLCIAYWLVPSRNADAGKWSEISIANRCPSQFPYIVKCRLLLEMGDFSEAVACLDQAERFFYSIGNKQAYASILKERSALMDNYSSP